MPNLLVYTYRGINNRIKNKYFNLPEKVKCLVISPGGCGSVNLIKYLNKYIKSNLYLERKYKLLFTAHLYKPPKILEKEKIKIILIKRNLNEIYNSLKSRNFVKNSLNLYGDLFPFIYINIFKSDNKLKKKFINYLKFFYNNWKLYKKDIILEIDYKNIYSNKNAQNKIKKFLDIKDKKFIKKFPKFKKYNKKKNFVDPSSLKK
tara:strand:+ start:1185 stop:1796 length:612 start_codon:yes stop_codon:yes gene_type:complete